MTHSTSTTVCENPSDTNDEFDALVQAWMSHQDLRAANVPIAELAQSRFTLDQRRDDARRWANSVPASLKARN